MQVLFRLSVCVAGQVMVGGVVSVTVTVNVQLLEFPLASVAVMVTTVGPVIVAPDAGDCVLVIDPDAVQLSETVARDT